ncbi:MFS transporter [Desulfatitalea tepidiphila]|uniref:MFS transporter n=1 Tax=Desulfatitalea tepidiphila TaxID=1185843 RepID=UPI0006B56C85|nr:MFS transporter [Desulfatitalea tepidiphila]
MKLSQLIPIYIGAAIGPMGGFGIVTILPVMAHNWSVSFGSISVAITAYMMPFIAIQIFSGAIAQIFDARRTLLFGFTGYAIGALFSGLSSNFGTFLAFRIVQGIGAGFLTPIIMALIGELVPEKHIGKAIGFLGVAYTVGVTLGPYLSGAIEVRLGWAFFFYFLSVVALLAGLFYLLTSTSQERPMDRQANLLDIFPLLKSAVREPGTVLLSFAAFALFFGYIGIMTFTADDLKTLAGLPSDKIGTILSITGLSGIVVSPIAGYVGDRVGRKIVFVFGSLIAIIAIGLMLWLPYGFFNRLLLFLLLGTGAATAWTSLNTMAVRISTSLRQPVTSIYNAIKFSGYAVSPAVLALLYAPYKLQAVQVGSMLAIAAATILALSAKPRMN